MKNIGELLDLKHKKSLRFGLLLLSTLLITSASALVYYSIVARTTATTSTAGVKFLTGSDTPAGYFINSAGTYASISVKSYPNATLTYDRALNVSNTDASTHQVRIRSVAISGGSSSYQNSTSKIEFDFLNAAGTVQGSITYTAPGKTTWTQTATGTGACITGSCTSAQYVTISANPTQWTIRIITVADAAAATGVVTTIDVAIDVQ